LICGTSRESATASNSIRPGDFLGRAIPVLRGEGEHGEHLDAALAAMAKAGAQRIHALLVAGHARQVAPGRPAPVAVHDDGNVVWNPALRHGGFTAQTAIISCSFPATN
jgi:hypothetical protein